MVTDNKVLLPGQTDAHHELRKVEGDGHASHHDKVYRDEGLGFTFMAENGT